MTFADAWQLALAGRVIERDPRGYEYEDRRWRINGGRLEISRGYAAWEECNLFYGGDMMAADWREALQR